ncbi:MAG: hypothetical protein HC890_08510 [Chloroflexaceae bacterium]|nr:hypothetical protein [Chloroflexaceae bacterium]
MRDKEEIVDATGHETKCSDLAKTFWVIEASRSSLSSLSIFPAFGTYSLDASQGKIYFNDIWSNMHYGYIGRIVGFTERELIDGAAVAQAVDDLINEIGIE